MSKQPFWCAMLVDRNGRRCHVKYKHISAEQALRIWESHNARHKFYTLLYLIKVTPKRKVKAT